MSYQAEKELAATLATYFTTSLPTELLPVAPEDFRVDQLAADRPSMSLNITGGDTLRRYIDGSRLRELEFSIVYRAFNLDGNAAKSAMLGTLNGIGVWLDSTPLPDLGAGIKARRLEQTSTAGRLEQDPNETPAPAANSTYSAGFVLEYVRAN